MLALAFRTLGRWQLARRPVARLLAARGPSRHRPAPAPAAGHVRPAPAVGFLFHPTGAIRVPTPAEEAGR